MGRTEGSVATTVCGWLAPSQMCAALPLVGKIVALTTLLLLLLTGSVLLRIKTLLMNVMTLAATLGTDPEANAKILIDPRSETTASTAGAAAT